MEKDCLLRIVGRFSVYNIIRRRCGMSKAVFSTLSVMVLWVIYLLLGSAVFIYLEETHLTVSVVGDHQHWSRFKELVSAGAVVEELFTLRDNLLNLCPHTIFNNSFSQMENGPVIIELRNATTRSPLFSGLQKLELDGDWREQVEKECTDSLRIIHEVTETNSWSMADAVYFTMTTITSIGYGHIVPMTKAGKRFCVVYTLVGVPVTCILLTNYADMLCNCIFQLYTTAKKRHQRHQKALLHGIILMVICVGLTLLTLLPSVVLSKLEDWSYEDALYFTFNTITTIGFGDLIAGDNTDVPYRDLYKMGIVVWIMLVLIYWFLLHSFLKKALKNVAVHKIKKTKNMSTRVTMQSAFFTELVGKVVSQRVHEVKHKDELASDPEMVALILAVADVLDPRRTFHEHKIIPTVQDKCNSRSEDQTITLSQLLAVNVIIRADIVPSITSVIAPSINEHETSKTLSSVLNQDRSGLSKAAQSQDFVQRQPKEVSLSLREVLSLVVLIKSIEDEVTAQNSNDSRILIQDDVNSPSSSRTIPHP